MWCGVGGPRNSGSPVLRTCVGGDPSTGGHHRPRAERAPRADRGEGVHQGIGGPHVRQLPEPPDHGRPRAGIPDADDDPDRAEGGEVRDRAEEVDAVVAGAGLVAGVVDEAEHLVAAAHLDDVPLPGHARPCRRSRDSPSAVKLELTPPAPVRAGRGGPRPRGRRSHPASTATSKSAVVPIESPARPCSAASSASRRNHGGCRSGLGRQRGHRHEAHDVDARQRLGTRPSSKRPSAAGRRRPWSPRRRR